MVVNLLQASQMFQNIQETIFGRVSVLRSIRKFQKPLRIFLMFPKGLQNKVLEILQARTAVQ